MNYTDEMSIGFIYTFGVTEAHQQQTFFSAVPKGVSSYQHVQYTIYYLIVHYTSYQHIQYTIYYLIVHYTSYQHIQYTIYYLIVH